MYLDHSFQWEMPGKSRGVYEIGTDVYRLVRERNNGGDPVNEIEN
jgi:hypothetical protein